VKCQDKKEEDLLKEIKKRQKNEISRHYNVDSCHNFYNNNWILIYHRKSLQMTINIKEILFYIFLILSMILLVWSVFRNSPSEFVTLVSIMFTLLLKMWAISDRQIRLENGFKHLAHDFKEHITKK